MTPEQVKLPPRPGRRTPGLRREEVALLAGVSVTWYTWLEQGRRINASTDVLRSIGRALRLDEAGQDHLVSLAQPVPRDGSGRSATPDEVPSSLRRLIEAFEPAPAYVLGPHWEFAAWNDAEARLYPPHRASTAIERNLIWVLFAHADVRRPDRRLGHPRPPGAGRVPGRDDRRPPRPRDGRARRPALSEASAEFRAWWPEHDVARFETRLRRFNHPRAGLLTFEYQQLTPAEWPALRVVVQLARARRRLGPRLAVRHDAF